MHFFRFRQRRIFSAEYRNALQIGRCRSFTHRCRKRSLRLVSLFHRYTVGPTARRDRNSGNGTKRTIYLRSADHKLRGEHITLLIAIVTIYASWPGQRYKFDRSGYTGYVHQRVLSEELTFDDVLLAFHATMQSYCHTKITWSLRSLRNFSVLLTVDSHVNSSSKGF